MTIRSARRESGFTMIEVLVTIVIIAMLLGLLLPVLARAQETARIAECKANLRQIGQAITTYSGDYGDWTPPTYGWLDWTDAGTGRLYQDRADDRMSSFTIMCEVGPSRSSATPRPATGSGLGLLWTAGLLGAKAGKLLYCPSQYNESLADGYPNDLDLKFKFDFDEPCWVAARKVELKMDSIAQALVPMLSNQNGTADMGEIHSSYPGNHYGNAVLSGYWLRTQPRTAAVYQTTDNSYTYNAWRVTGNMNEDFKGAIVSDIIGGNWPSVCWARVNHATNTPQEYHTTAYVQNHDKVYNVLFVDGAVRTYSDATSQIKKLLARMLSSATAAQQAGVCDYLSDKVFPAYFDALLTAEN